jgi:hypothetical protein
MPRQQATQGWFGEGTVGRKAAVSTIAGGSAAALVYATYTPPPAPIDTANGDEGFFDLPPGEAPGDPNYVDGDSGFFDVIDGGPDFADGDAGFFDSPGDPSAPPGIVDQTLADIRETGAMVCNNIYDYMAENPLVGAVAAGLALISVCFLGGAVKQSWNQLTADTDADAPDNDPQPPVP